MFICCICKNVLFVEDSARSVGEEIDYDDDFDIVSTGRPTPRIDLNATPTETPRKDDKHSKEGAKHKDEEKSNTTDKKDKDTKESARDVKGNSSNKVVDSYAHASTAKKENRTDDVKAAEGNNEKQGKEKGEKKQDEHERKRSEHSVSSKGAVTKSGETETLLTPSKSRENENSSSRRIKDESSKSSPKSKKPDRSDRPASLDFVDEIFRSSRNTRRFLEKEFETIADDMSTEEQPKKKTDTEENLKEFKTHKSNESTPKVAPRKDKKDVKTPGRSKGYARDDWLFACIEIKKIVYCLVFIYPRGNVHVYFCLF